MVKKTIYIYKVIYIYWPIGITMPPEMCRVIIVPYLSFTIIVKISEFLFCVNQGIWTGAESGFNARAVDGFNARAVDGFSARAVDGFS